MRLLRWIGRRLRNVIVPDSAIRHWMPFDGDARQLLRSQLRYTDTDRIIAGGGYCPPWDGTERGSVVVVTTQAKSP